MTNTIPHTNFINASKNTLAQLTQVQAGGFDVAHAIASAVFAGRSKSDVRHFAFALLKSARKAAKKGWTDAVYYKDNTCYGLCGAFGGNVDYVPLFGTSQI